jgi:hypothetical protein
MKSGSPGYGDSGVNRWLRDRGLLQPHGRQQPVTIRPGISSRNRAGGSERFLFGTLGRLLLARPLSFASPARPAARSTAVISPGRSFHLVPLSRYSCQNSTTNPRGTVEYWVGRHSGSSKDRSTRSPGARKCRTHRNPRYNRPALPYMKDQRARRGASKGTRRRSKRIDRRIRRSHIR